ncbi:RimJ/RimL family protein N-acetyltransferase [Cytobacillus purgationiresistens]|uniref:RimJ/RimL family protein N-acetyltransferase n=1 Tax=Cytobacillus purgationiresistens TaxID=863449 RepID=A0ABU0ANE4_9BACI|nr:RimJ/RimL family protein N-acetyltransferase [Cytobacillus purgationiresistens]
MKLETERLILRLYTYDDYENWYTQHDCRLPSQYQYDDGRPANISSYTEVCFNEQVRRWQELAKADELYQLGIFRKEDGVHIGKIELYRILRMDYQWAMMGYSIHNQFWKNGYATESVKAAVQAAFTDMGFHRIELHINVDNEPSIRLAEKTGFQYESTRKQFLFEHGRWSDFLVYYQNRDDDSSYQGDS